MKRRKFLATLSSGALVTLLTGCEGLNLGSNSKESQRTTVDSPPQTTTNVRTTYRSHEQAQNLPKPVGLIVRSQISADRTLRISVLDGDRKVYGEVVEIQGGETVIRNALVQKRGRYRVLVESPSRPGTSRFDWRVRNGFGNLELELTKNGIEMKQRVECTPGCPPVSQGGEAASLPYVSDSIPLLDPAWIEVSNPTATTRSATIRVADGSNRFLDYTYEVAPGLRPSIPAVASAGTYAVSVQSGTVSRRHDWIVPEQPRLQVRLSDPPQIDCGDAVGTITVGNQDEVPHAVVITVKKDDRKLYEKFVGLYSGEFVALPKVVAESGYYQIRVESDTGVVATKDWWVCKGSSRAVIEVEVTGLLTIDTIFRY